MGRGATEEDLAKIGRWIAAGGWGQFRGQPVAVAFLIANFAHAQQAAAAWDGKPMDSTRQRPRKVVEA